MRLARELLYFCKPCSAAFLLKEGATASQGAGILAPRINPPYALKTL